MDRGCRLSVHERDSLNHTLDGCGWDLAQRIRNRRFHATASQDVNRVTGKLFRLIDLALRKARQEEVVEYQTLCAFPSLPTETDSDSRASGTGRVRCMRRCGWHQDSEHRITIHERRQLTGAHLKARTDTWTGAAKNIDTCAPRLPHFARMNEHEIGREDVGRRCRREPQRLLRTDVVLV